MHILPQTNRDWFDLSSFTLKVGVTFAAPVLLVYHHTVASLYNMSCDVHWAMEVVAQPVEFFCLLASLLLFMAGIIERFRWRRKKAIWDFVFMVLALFCWQLAAFFIVPVR